MTALDRTPSNQNFLQTDGYQLILKRCPTVVFFTQSINIPGLSLPPTEEPTPFIKLPIPGDHIDFEDLSFQFKIDENMLNYLEIYNWLIALGYPDEHEQYKKLSDKPKYTNDGIYSDISILIANNIKNPNIEITFKNAFPIYLSGFNLSTTSTEIDLANASATFKYEKYEIKSLLK